MFTFSKQEKSVHEHMYLAYLSHVFFGLFKYLFMLFYTSLFKQRHKRQQLEHDILKIKHYNDIVLMYYRKLASDLYKFISIYFSQFHENTPWHILKKSLQEKSSVTAVYV